MTDSDLAINRKSYPFRGVNVSLSDQIATRHLHGTCASRIRRVKRPPCACLELRWTGGISDGKEDPDREDRRQKKMRKWEMIMMMGCGLGWTQDGYDGKSRCECSI